MTVKELKEQLEILEQLGMADAQVIYRDHLDIDSDISQGVIDNTDNIVVLG